MENEYHGAVLSDVEIHEALRWGSIDISGMDGEPYVGPSSVDLHLDNKALVLDDAKVRYSTFKNNDSLFTGIDTADSRKSSDLFSPFNGWDAIVLMPGEFYILSTIERIRFPDDVCGFIQGRSSLARIGINVHNAGFFDAGFAGTATLEVTNLTKYPIKIAKGTRICQMVFVRQGKSSMVPYHAKKDKKYYEQHGPTLTKMYSDSK